MATITITIPDAQVQRVIDALCARGKVDRYHIDLGDPPGVVDAPNAKAALIDLVKQLVVAYETLNPANPGEPDVT